MGLRLKFNLVLAGVFLVGLAAASLIFWQVAQQNAREQIRSQIEVLRAQALAVRRYTSEEIRPLLSDQSEIQFLPQTVPSFSAQSAFENFRSFYPNFRYREAALNPTNPDDLATAFEVGLIEQLRSDRSLQEIEVVHETDSGATYTVAFPLEIRSEGCLTCHSTPEAAPASMIALYGTEGGFGWRLNEIIGAQVISVPLSLAQDQAWRSLQVMIGSISAIFVVSLLLLNVLLSRMVIAPVRRMANLGERVSMGDFSEPEYVRQGGDEIASLSGSFNRMRRSLESAMKMLDD